MADKPLFDRLPTHESRLENGLTVLVRENHSSPVVAIVTHVKAGYFNEPDHLVGISHVLEHMYFKGTERRGPGVIARETKAAGGELNAGTIYDYTSYYTVLPSSSLEMGLDIQSDALRNSQIDEEELRKELLVIIQESKRKLDNPGAVAVESLYEELFEVHPMRRWRIGTEEGLQRLTRQDVWDYYRNLYRPSNIVLAIAGDVDPDRTLELVRRCYGDMPAGEAIRDRAPEEPERRGFRFREMAGDVVHTHAEFGWRTPGTLHPDTPPLDLLEVVLGGGRASRLYRGVREAGWVTAVGAANYTPTDLGVFRVGAELLPADTRPALEGIWREVERLRGEPVSRAELERAQNILEASFVRRFETVEGQANLLAEWQALGDWRLASTYLDQLLAATAADLLRVAREYLDLERGALLVYLPEAAGALGWDSAEARAMLEAAVGARADVRPSPEPAAAALAAGPRPPEFQRLEVEDEVHFFALEHGVRLVVKPRRSSALVSMAIACAGGALHETQDTAEITRLMARVSIKGTATRSAARLAEETESLGGAISPGVSSDHLFWSLGLPSRHFEHGFSLLADAALRPSFPEAEVERERKVALSDLEQLRDDMYRYPLRLLIQSAFADHPYGFSVQASEASLRALGRSDLERWHRERVLEGELWVFLVGDIEPDPAAAVVARELVGPRGGAARDGASPPVWPVGPRAVVEERAKAQTALMLGFPGPRRGEPELYALRVAANAVSGLGGRIFEELRDRRSLAYTVAAYPLVWRLAGAFVAYIATSPEREDEARSALLAELYRLSEDLLPEDEIERAKRYMIGSWQIRGQTNGAQLNDLVGALLLGKGLSELREFEQRVRAVTPEAIRDAARRWFDPQRLVEGVVRGTGGGR